MKGEVGGPSSRSEFQQGNGHPPKSDQASRHVWISSEPLSGENVHQRWNLGARHRWGIESGILVVKRHGYQYEHCFSYNWDAMRGYHFLMRLAHLINTLAQKAARLAGLVRRRGLRGLIQFLRETCAGPWLDPERILQIFKRTMPASFGVSITAVAIRPPKSPA